ncbi:hypothetical protein RCL1_006702 [Eukaryota sp. TZLM3-RCL]
MSTSTAQTPHIIVVPPNTCSFTVVEALKSSNQFVIKQRSSLTLNPQQLQYVFMSKVSLLDDFQPNSLVTVEFLYVVGSANIHDLPSHAFTIPPTQFHDVMDFVFGDQVKTLLHNTAYENLIETDRREYLDDILKVVHPALEELLRVVERKQLIDKTSDFDPIEWLGAYLLRNKSR